ncbi:hypothetical protein SAMN04488156_11282 [Bacillus sp. 166amftsu]|nr:hypothetical protein SAMN04488156_11282 [Bacillus sp. 166amftsu]
MPLKTRMKEYRVKLHMSQEDLANKVGVRREGSVAKFST